MGIINGYTLYKDNCNKAYAEILRTTGKMSFMEIRSQEFINELRSSFFAQTGNFPPSNNLLQQSVEHAAFLALQN
ncbi:MAG TPA: hypothetical protein VJ438_05290, partial [Candidatus Nanoarchaeia archaeon]|nr:hypothetical protein [Candidatus Nanoarchaeia archaeon]